MNDISPEIQTLIDRGDITVDEMKSLICNSWEWEAITPALTDEALLAKIEHVLANCERGGKRPYVVYDDALKHHYTPELMRRLQYRHTPELLCKNNSSIRITANDLQYAKERVERDRRVRDTLLKLAPQLIETMLGEKPKPSWWTRFVRWVIS